MFLDAADEAIGQAGLLSHPFEPTRVGISIESELSRPALTQIADRFDLIDSGQGAKALKSSRPSEFLARVLIFRDRLSPPPWVLWTDIDNEYCLYKLGAIDWRRIEIDSTR